MFNEFLQSHPLATLIDSRPTNPFPAARDRARWAALSVKDAETLRALAEHWRDIPWPVLTASQFAAFAREGSRAAWEAPYFARRKKLIAALMGYCLQGSEADLTCLIDGLWLICEESSWVISAHNGSAHEGQRPASERVLPDVRSPYIDLFAAQTAMILTLACDMAAEALDAFSPLLRRRVRAEVEARVLTPFEIRDDFWWMGFIRKDLCNWTPWIVSNAMLCACGWVEDVGRLCEILTRGCGMLDRYLAVMPEDGGCDEGAGYWNMAGGALLDCLELLEQVTGGKMTFWQDEKLANLLRFPLNAWIGGDWFVNFADCDAKPEICGERLRFAGRRLGDPALTAMGERFLGAADQGIADTPQLWRMLLRLFPEEVTPARDPSPDAAPPRDVWLPDLQMRLVRRGGVTLAAKGGVNEGSHNHNDCGSFMLYLGGEPQIVDAGNMTYTAQTFSERRYELWNTRGRYHNVPVIGQWEQAAGWHRAAKDVACLPDGLSLDMADAYPEAAGVIFARRALRLSDDGQLTLRDELCLRAPQRAEWTFLLRGEPTLLPGALRAGGIQIIAEGGALAGNWQLSVECIQVDDPRMARNFPGRLWRAALSLPAAAAHNVTFTIGRAKGDAPR